MRLVRTDRHPADPTRDHGQSLVEFALVLLPLFFIMLGIVQFGLIFNSYVTITNAAREGARSGSVYIYDATMSKAQRRRKASSWRSSSRSVK